MPNEAEDEIIEAMIDAYDDVYEGDLRNGVWWADSKPNAMREALRVANSFVKDSVSGTLIAALKEWLEPWSGFSDFEISKRCHPDLFDRIKRSYAAIAKAGS